MWSTPEELQRGKHSLRASTPHHCARHISRFPFSSTEIDELGYLPIDKFGADCLFQIISHRYERGSTVLTTNRPYKQWAGIFNNDATLTSALLDRLLDHVETAVIEGKSYRGQSHAEI